MKKQTPSGPPQISFAAHQAHLDKFHNCACGSYCNLNRLDSPRSSQIFNEKGQINTHLKTNWQRNQRGVRTHDYRVTLHMS